MPDEGKVSIVVVIEDDNIGRAVERVLEAAGLPARGGQHIKFIPK